MAREGAAAAVDPLEGPLTKEATPGEKGLEPARRAASRSGRTSSWRTSELVVRLLLRGELVDLRVQQLLRVALAVGEVEGPPQVDVISANVLWMRPSASSAAAVRGIR